MAGNIVLRVDPTIPDRITKTAFRDAMKTVGAEMLAQAISITDKPYPPASNAFQPPHKRSGRHQGGLDFTVSRDGALNLRINTKQNAPHSKFLQTGTSRMLPRLTWEHVMFQRGSTNLKRKWINRIAVEARKSVRRARGLPRNAPI